MSKQLPILCIDWDGVIHSYSSGWKGADVIPDPPVEGAIEFLRKAVEHFRVAIYSSRSGQPGGIAAMQRWLHTAIEQTEMYPAWFKLIEWPTEKPPAFLTIDDRAITFDGTWPEMQTLKGLQNMDAEVKELTAFDYDIAGKLSRIEVERHKGSWWVVFYVADDRAGWNGPYTDKADAEKTANLNRLSYGLEIESTGHAC